MAGQCLRSRLLFSRLRLWGSFLAPLPPHLKERALARALALYVLHSATNQASYKFRTHDLARSLRPALRLLFSRLGRERPRTSKSVGVGAGFAGSSGADPGDEALERPLAPQV